MTRRFHYGQLMHKALRGLMSEVLSDVAENGLPGAHHFFITFDTRHPGVDIPDYLRARHPEEMTIVLQEWFEDLTVIGDRFAVTVNFGNQPEPLVIPFDSIRTFVDPSVEFGLRFDPTDEPESPDDLDEELDDTEAEDAPDVPRSGGGDVVSLDRFRKH
ncbi:SspB family protein [Oceanibium sediminis]|uniref:SspB family protein n=1 Tax=Oceanibium sediminis TaxID=2026339 RepID=UPI000DD3CCAC|nr:ClpXP protease specificity-enhancing factor SspB [Oceanibium sediminis]